MPDVLSNQEQQQEIHRLEAEHSALERRLTRLRRSVYLTRDEDQEVRRIKRQKLWAKDRIHYLRAQRRRAEAAG